MLFFKSILNRFDTIHRVTVNTYLLGMFRSSPHFASSVVVATNDSSYLLWIYSTSKLWANNPYLHRNKRRRYYLIEKY